MICHLCEIIFVTVEFKKVSSDFIGQPWQGGVVLEVAEGGVPPAALGPPNEPFQPRPCPARDVPAAGRCPGPRSRQAIVPPFDPRERVPASLLAWGLLPVLLLCSSATGKDGSPAPGIVHRPWAFSATFVPRQPPSPGSGYFNSRPRVPNSVTPGERRGQENRSSATTHLGCLCARPCDCSGSLGTGGNLPGTLLSAPPSDP